ncbi:Bacteriophage T5 Orf172 DNA-binding domain-containing protein [Candidatus Electrothrix aarhusensis]
MSILIYVILSSVLTSCVTFYIVWFIYKKKNITLSGLSERIKECEEELASIDLKIQNKTKICENVIKLETDNLRKKHSEAREYIRILKGKVSVARDKYQLLLKGEKEKYIQISDSIKEEINLLQKKSVSIKEKSDRLDKAIKDLDFTVKIKNERLVEIEKRTKKPQSLEEKSDNIKMALDKNSKKLSRTNDEINKNEGTLKGLQSELDLYSRIKEYVDYGIYKEPEYLYETPERYQAEIKNVREEQKKLIKENEAVELAEEIKIKGSSKTAHAVLKDQAKLMIRTFNIECDKLLDKLRPSNFDRTLERIEKIAEGLEKTTVSLSTGITFPYIQLKFEECRLLYEYKLKKAAQDEEQRLIREQIREEARLTKEYEKAIAEANREEKLFKTLLEKVQEQLDKAHEGEKDELQGKIMLLETQLQEAEEMTQRAKSMAEQTRKGHVYIVSNIGSFGDEIYKIGLTRRLDPQERVKELGGASVPFAFDVHAMIYSDDAPALESALHKRFDQVRVNAINRRKEFFKVSLEEIKSATKEIAGDETDFTMTAIAEDYYETLRLQGGYR